MKPFPRVKMGKIIRQEEKQKRKEEDEVCTLHFDFVTLERLCKKKLLFNVVILIKPFFPKD